MGSGRATGLGMMTPRDFAAFVREADHGEGRVYYTGNLARDRRPWTDDKGVEHPAVPGVDALAKAAMKAAERGDVRLYQRRRGPDRWDYVVLRTLPMRTPLRGYSFGRTVLQVSA